MKIESLKFKDSLISKFIAVGPYWTPDNLFLI